MAYLKFSSQVLEYIIAETSVVKVTNLWSDEGLIAVLVLLELGAVDTSDITSCNEDCNI